MKIKYKDIGKDVLDCCDTLIDAAEEVIYSVDFAFDYGARRFKVTVEEVDPYVD